MLYSQLYDHHPLLKGLVQCAVCSLHNIIRKSCVVVQTSPTPLTHTHTHTHTQAKLQESIKLLDDFKEGRLSPDVTNKQVSCLSLSPSPSLSLSLLPYPSSCVQFNRVA